MTCRNTQAEAQHNAPKIHSTGQFSDPDAELDYLIASRTEDLLDADNVSQYKADIICKIVQTDEQVTEQLYKILGSNINLKPGAKLTNEESIELLNPLQLMRCRIEDLVEQKVREDI